MIEKVSDPQVQPPSSSRRPRRLLHVIASMSPRDGGPPEGVKQLAKNFRALGDEVEAVTLDAPTETFLADFDFKVHAVGPPLVHYGFSRPLVKWLAANVPRFDLIIIDGLWLFHGVAAWRAAKKANVPFVVFTHGALDVFFKKRYPLKHMKKMAYWPVQYRVLKAAQQVLFTSESERDLAAASFTPNDWVSLVVPYGTNRPEGDRAAQIEAFYTKLPQLRGKRFLLFLSRIHEKKGCDLLIEAFAKVAAAHPGTDLVMAGPDQVGLQATLEAQAKTLDIADRVHWPGMLGGDSKDGAFYAAYAFILPSHQENFGIAVAEALARGTPVLISDQINIWHEIVEEQVGLVEPDTLEGTHQLLLRWFALPEDERAAMAARAIPAFEKRYSLRRTAETIHALSQR